MPEIADATQESKEWLSTDSRTPIGVGIAFEVAVYEAAPQLVQRRRRRSAVEDVVGASTLQHGGGSETSEF